VLAYYEGEDEKGVLKGELPLKGATVVTLTGTGKFAVTVNAKMFKKHKNAGTPIGFYRCEKSCACRACACLACARLRLPLSLPLASYPRALPLAPR